MPRQYVHVRLSTKPSARPYVYLNDQPDDIQVGHHVEVDLAYGPAVRKVVAVSDTPPSDLPTHVTPKHCRKV